MKEVVSLRIKRSPKIIAGAAVIGLITAGGAFAFWTAQGSGTGSAATGDTQGLVVTQVAPTKYLTPGVRFDVHGNIHNPNDGRVQINGLTAVISVVPAAGKTCTADNYVFTPSYIDGGWVGGMVEHTLNPNDIEWYGTLGMVDSVNNQDGCKGATVNLAYSTN